MPDLHSHMHHSLYGTHPPDLRKERDFGGAICAAEVTLFRGGQQLSQPPVLMGSEWCLVAAATSSEPSHGPPLSPPSSLCPRGPWPLHPTLFFLCSPKPERLLASTQVHRATPHPVFLPPEQNTCHGFATSGPLNLHFAWPGPPAAPRSKSTPTKAPPRLHFISVTCHAPRVGVPQAFRRERNMAEV